MLRRLGSSVIRENDAEMKGLNAQQSIGAVCFTPCIASPCNTPALAAAAIACRRIPSSFLQTMPEEVYPCDLFRRV